LQVGHTNLKSGSYVYTAGDGAWDGVDAFPFFYMTVEDNVNVIVDGYDPEYGQWPEGVALNYIIADDGDKWPDDLPLGDGAFAVTARDGSVSFEQYDAPDPWTIRTLTDDGSVQDVTLAATAGNEMNIRTDIDLRNGDADERATLHVGFAPGTEPFVPGVDDLDYAQAGSGSVRIRAAGTASTHHLGDVVVEGGELEFGYNHNAPDYADFDALNPDIDGTITVRDGAALTVQGRYVETDYQAHPLLFAGDLGTEQIVENGGTLAHRMRNVTDAGEGNNLQEVSQAVRFEQGATTDPDARSTWIVDEEFRGADRTTWDPASGTQHNSDGYYYPNVAMDDAYVVLDTDHVNRNALHLDLDLTGTSTLTGDNATLTGLTGAGTLNLGDPAADGWDGDIGIDIRGALTGGTLVLQNGEIDVHADPGSALVRDEMSAAPGNDPGNTDWWIFDLFYGKLADGVDEDSDGNALYEEWGAGAAFEVGGKHTINIRVDEDADEANDLNTNVFAGTVRALDTHAPGTAPVWDTTEKTLDATMDAYVRADRDADMGRGVQLVEVGTLALEDGALATTANEDANLNFRAVDVEGDTGYLWSNSRAHDTIGDVTGLGTASVLTVFGDVDTGFNGTVTDADIVYIGDDDAHLRDGFDLNGNTFTYQMSDQLNLYTDPGDGTFYDQPSVVDEDNFNAGTNQVQLQYGGDAAADEDGDADPLTESWGEGTTFEVAHGNELRLYVDRVAGNVNEFAGTVRILDRTDNYDGYLRSVQGTDAGEEGAVAYFSDVQVGPQTDPTAGNLPEVRLDSDNNTIIRADFVLEGDTHARAVGSGGDNYYIGNVSDANPGDGTPVSLVVIPNGDAEQIYLDGTLGPEANLVLDFMGEEGDEWPASEVRIGAPLSGFGGLILNGQAITVQRTEDSATWDGALVIEDGAALQTPGAGTTSGGTIVVDNGIVDDDDPARLEFRTDHDGAGDEQNWNIDVQIQNEGEVQGRVDQAMVGPVQTINQTITIMNADGDFGAVDAYIDAEGARSNLGTADTGDSSGRVEFNDVVLADGARAELRVTDTGDVSFQMPRLLVSPTATGTGQAALVNDTSDTRIFIRDVGYEGDDQTLRLEMHGGQRTRWVGNVSGHVITYAEATLEDGFQVTGAGQFDVEGPTFLMTDVAGDGISIGGGDDDILYIATMGNTNFDPDDLMLSGDDRVGLVVDRSLSDEIWDGNMGRIIVGKEAYNATLTLTHNQTEIGAGLTDRAGIETTLQGTATNVTFAGGDSLLHLAENVIDQTGLGGGSDVSVAYDRDVTISAGQNYAGGTMVNGGHVRVFDGGALGTGDVNAMGGTLDLHADISNNVGLGGGGIYGSDGPRQVTGALTDEGTTDAAGMALAAEDSLTFTKNLTINGPRTVDVAEGTVAFAGTVASDGGPWTVTKTGDGTLR
ncbi:MAG: hypothetical protein ACOC95_10550, partial [Planctomycetota bacterium]